MDKRARHLYVKVRTSVDKNIFSPCLLVNSHSTPVDKGDRHLYPQVNFPRIPRIFNEMLIMGYSMYEINELFLPLEKMLIKVYSTYKHFGKAKDLSHNRRIPVFDALHALIARDNKAILITRDEHFNKLLDIIRFKKPEELI